MIGAIITGACVAILWAAFHVVVIGFGGKPGLFAILTVDAMIAGTILSKLGI
jgi:hypothetical protein